MEELKEILGHLNGIKGILPQMEGVPLTPTNAKIALAIGNSVDIVISMVSELAEELGNFRAQTLDNAGTGVDAT